MKKLNLFLFAAAILGITACSEQKSTQSDSNEPAQETEVMATPMAVDTAIAPDEILKEAEEIESEVDNLLQDLEN